MCDDQIFETRNQIHKSVKPSYICYQPRQPQEAVNKYQSHLPLRTVTIKITINQSTHIITENIHTLKIYASFRSCQFVLHLDCVTSYSVVFDWKNLQTEELYTLIPVPITCRTLTTKICPFSDLHITLYREQFYYSRTAKKYLLLAYSNSKVR